MLSGRALIYPDKSPDEVRMNEVSVFFEEVA